MASIELVSSAAEDQEVTIKGLDPESGETRSVDVIVPGNGFPVDSPLYPGEVIIHIAQKRDEITIRKKCNPAGGPHESQDQA